MALRKKRWLDVRRLAIGIAMLAAVPVLSAPAGAQFFDDRYPTWGRQQYEPPPRDNFPFFSDRPFRRPAAPFIRPPQPVESTKAPPPRKLDNPPASTVVVIGDELADWLAYGLEETYGDSPDVSVERKIRPTSGLVRYDPKNDALEWPQTIKDMLATEKPSAIVVMLGINDRLQLRDRVPPRPGPQPAQAAGAAGQASQNAPQGQGAAPAQPAPPVSQARDGEQPPDAAADAQHPVPGGSYDFHTDKWAELYSKRIDEMIAALKSKGVPVLWVALPAIRGTKSTSDMSYLDELYRARAEKAGITYVDIWDGFVDDQGRYVLQGPDFEGQTRRLRTYDGVHFTKAGAVKLASYVEHELRRVMTSHVVPVALPGPEQTAPKPGSPRPAIGPVLPLTATSNSGSDGGDLLGGGNGHAAPAASDPTANDVLSRGDPVAAPPGRADDFSWPRPDANATPAIAPEPAPSAPAAPPKKGAAGKTNSKTDAKSKTAPDAPAGATRRSPSAELDGAPRPPAAVGTTVMTR
jgi:hypothetical protein